MKKSRISWILSAVFITGFLLSVKYFENEGAGFLLIASIVAMGLSIYYEKLDK